MGAVHKLYPTAGLTQCQKVIQHVEETGGITSWEAINHYGITRLAARVHELDGSNNAMKAEDIGDGYVRYVIDWKKRLKFIREEISLMVALESVKSIATRLPPKVVEFNNAYRMVLRTGGW